MQHSRHKRKSRNADFILIARRAIPSPLNLLNLLNPLNPHAAGVSNGDTFPFEPFEPSEPSEPGRAAAAILPFPHKSQSAML